MFKTNLPNPSPEKRLATMYRTTRRNHEVTTFSRSALNYALLVTYLFLYIYALFSIIANECLYQKPNDGVKRVIFVSSCKM
jgi:hypothetical protein